MSSSGHAEGYSEGREGLRIPVLPESDADLNVGQFFMDIWKLNGYAKSGNGEVGDDRRRTLEARPEIVLPATSGKPLVVVRGRMERYDRVGVRYARATQSIPRLRKRELQAEAFDEILLPPSPGEGMEWTRYLSHRVEKYARLTWQEAETTLWWRGQVISEEVLREQQRLKKAEPYTIVDHKAANQANEAILQTAFGAQMRLVMSETVQLLSD